MIRLSAILVPIVALFAAGCGNGRLVLPMSLDRHAAQAFPASQAIEQRTFTTHRDAVRETAAILRDTLQLPVPDHFTVFVYPSRARFEEGLVRDAHIAPVRAAELADFAIGVGKRRVLLFNDDGSAGHGREWVRLVAHELTHLAQFDLAEGEGRGEQWLVEGMAEWSAFRVLERMGLDTMTRRRRLARAGIRNQAAFADGDLDLGTLGSPRGFTRRHRHEGSLATYQLAFLMADYLIEREGLERVEDYFRSFRTSRNREQNFERAFGQSLDEFESEVLADLKGATP